MRRSLSGGRDGAVDHQLAHARPPNSRGRTHRAGRDRAIAHQQAARVGGEVEQLSQGLTVDQFRITLRDQRMLVLSIGASNDSKNGGTPQPPLLTQSPCRDRTRSHQFVRRALAQRQKVGCSRYIQHIWVHEGGLLLNRGLLDSLVVNLATTIRGQCRLSPISSKHSVRECTKTGNDDNFACFVSPWMP